ncbi:MAG: flagellar assembly protein FliW, partial [Clostridia bacterium]|nr:flagellar assembly protein FliW [Clostridia bacterium]
PDDMLVLVTITVPKQVENMTINLRAPIVIGGESKKACQIITEGEQYSVKYPIYQLLKLNKERAGE